jgi:hypothetical protein
MQPITAGEYDSVVDQWKEWQSYPWGKLLYTVSRFNLQRRLISIFLSRFAAQ